MQILCGLYFLELFHLQLLWCILVQAAQETVQQVAESSKEAANSGKGQICQPEMRNTISENLVDRTVRRKMYTVHNVNVSGYWNL